MLSLLKHHLLESHFHAVPHGLASWLDRELHSRLLEIQCIFKPSIMNTAMQHFIVKDFLGNPVAIVPQQQKRHVRNAKEKLTRRQQNGQENCLLLCENDDATQTQTKQNYSINSTGDPPMQVVGLPQDNTRHVLPVDIGDKIHIESERD